MLGGRTPAIQVNVDATAMVQAGLGSGYAQQIITTEIQDFLSRKEGAPLPLVNIDVRVMFNPNIDTAWFTSVMGIINNVTMLGIILAGAAIVREREHGTMDHLLVMPLTPFEIAMSKVWANGLVITIAAGLSLYLVVRTLLHVPIVGSVPLFMLGVAIYLFFTCAIGIFLGHGRAHHAAARFAVHVDLSADELAFRQQHAARKHAALAGDHDAGFAVDAFRVVRAGDSLPRRRLRRGLAAICFCRRGRRRVPCVRHPALPLDLGTGRLTSARTGFATRMIRMAADPTKRVPSPPHPQARRQPLPEHSSKSTEEDPAAPQALRAIRESPTYRLAEQDAEFIARADIRGPRLEIEYLKADVILAEQHIDHTIVVYGSTRITEPGAARRKVEVLRASVRAHPDDEELIFVWRPPNGFWPRAIIMMSRGNSGVWSAGRIAARNRRAW